MLENAFNWNIEHSDIALVIIRFPIEIVHLANGSVLDIAKVSERFPIGVHVNPNLDRDTYSRLLRLYHPDTSRLNSPLATEIARELIAARRGARGNSRERVRWEPVNAGVLEEVIPEESDPENPAPWQLQLWRYRRERARKSEVYRQQLAGEGENPPGIPLSLVSSGLPPAPIDYLVSRYGDKAWFRQDFPDSIVLAKRTGAPGGISLETRVTVEGGRISLHDRVVAFSRESCFFYRLDYDNLDLKTLTRIAVAEGLNDLPLIGERLRVFFRDYFAARSNLVRGGENWRLLGDWDLYLLISGYSGSR